MSLLHTYSLPLACAKNLCLSSCPAPPFAPPEGDYSESGFDDATLSTVCCLEYGAPYLSTGFALLSKLSVAPFDVLSALFNADAISRAGRAPRRR
jgi:hypothetical protein